MRERWVKTLCMQDSTFEYLLCLLHPHTTYIAYEKYRSSGNKLKSANDECESENANKIKKNKNE